MAKFTGGTTAIDFFNFDAQLGDLDDGTVTKATTTQFRRDEVIPTDYTDIFGTKLTYDGSNNLTGGTVNRIVSFDTVLQWDLSSLSMQAVTLNGLIAAGDGDDFLTAVFALNDFDYRLDRQRHAAWLRRQRHVERRQGRRRLPRRRQ